MHMPPPVPETGDLYPAVGGRGGAGDNGDLGPQELATDLLDDVFGADDDSLSAGAHGGVSAAAAAHPSDMTRLQKEHATAGYREGVTVAKEKSIQAGFDEGFSLGATIGQAAGQLLGILEGVAEALKGTAGTDTTDADKLYNEAKQELSSDVIFGKEYWAEDGNWAFPVDALDEKQVLFADVARCHPIIKKWTAQVDSAKSRWAIEPPILDDEGLQAADSADIAATEETTPITLSQTTNKALDW